jgi:hypothetical protein
MLTPILGERRPLAALIRGALFPLLLFVDPVHAQDRWRIAAQSPKETVFIDTVSINTVSGVKTFWAKTVPFVLKDAAPPEVAETINSFAINCPRRRFSLVQSTDYDAAGKSLGTSKINSEFEPIPPESLVEIFFEATCSGKWRKTWQEQMAAALDSSTLDLWRSMLQAKCPQRRIPDANLLRAMRATPMRARIDAADSITKALCTKAR